MFDWFWNFLYGITKQLLRLIDTIMHASKVLIGITPATINGNSEYLLDYFILSEPVDFAVKACAVLGFIFTMLLAVIAIIKSMAKDYKDGTPAQIGLKAFKAILMFIAVPVCMMAFLILGNAFMTAIYKATAQGSTSLGAFLFVNMAGDAAKGNFEDVKAQFLAFNEYTGTGYSYLNTSLVRSYVDLSDFNYILSWIIGAVLLYVIGTTFLSFVERIFSLILLYILAPFSIGSTVLDDGSRFKLWRDQVLVKFFSGYGTILAINIYCIVMGLLSSDSVRFFSGNDFLEFITKVIIIIGGGLSLKKSMALVGNLIQSGAGTGEMSGPLSAGGIVGSMLGLAATATGLSFTKDIIASGWGSMKRKSGEALFGLNGGGGGSPKDPKGGGGSGDDGGKGSSNDNQNTATPKYGSGNSISDQIQGNDGNNKNENNNNNNENNLEPAKQNDNGLMNAIEGNDELNANKNDDDNANNNA